MKIDVPEIKKNVVKLNHNSNLIINELTALN